MDTIVFSNPFDLNRKSDRKERKNHRIERNDKMVFIRCLQCGNPNGNSEQAFLLEFSVKFSHFHIKS